MSDTMTTNFLPFIYKTPDRLIKKVVPTAPFRPLHKNESLPKVNYVNKFIEKINNGKIYNEENECKVIQYHKKKHIYYPKYSKAYTPNFVGPIGHINVMYTTQASRGYNEYVKQKHCCSDSECDGVCGVLWCGCVDVCHKRCSENF
jgi:hypothetical protein